MSRSTRWYRSIWSRTGSGGSSRKN